MTIADTLNSATGNNRTADNDNEIDMDMERRSDTTTSARDQMRFQPTLNLILNLPRYVFIFTAILEASNFCKSYSFKFA